MTSPGRPNTALRRYELELGGYGVTRQDDMWIVPDNAPAALIAMVEASCDVKDMDWVYVGDRK